MTWSSAASLMPRTPAEVRPAKSRTSSIGKRTHLPAAVASSTSWSSLQVCTLTSRAPSSSFMAILPLAWTRTKSERRLRRTVPAEVANMTKNSSQVSSSSGMAMVVVMVSPSCSGSRFTIGRPRACGEATGSL